MENHQSSDVSVLTLEACVESLMEALHAEKEGAHRLELCSRLDLDGLTPDTELTRNLLDAVKIPVKVMIRPRAGDFYYTESEVGFMAEQIQSFKESGVFGVVFGMLEKDDRLNISQIEYLAKVARPLEVTIHKAIDLCDDPLNEIRKLKRTGLVHAVLSSGAAPTAREGQIMLRNMIREAGEDIRIIAAGKITAQNLPELHRAIGAREYHGRSIVNYK